MATAPPKPTPITKPKPLGQILSWIREILAICLWISLTTRALGIDIDAYLINTLLPSYTWLLQYRFISIVVLITLTTFLFGRQWFLTGTLYVLLYPLVILLWRIPAVLFRNWPLLIAFAPAIWSLFENLQTTITLSGLAIIFACTTLLTQNPYILTAAIIYLLFYLIRHYCNEFVHAFIPSGAFTGIKRKLEELNKTVIAIHQKESEDLLKLDKKSPQYESKYQAHLLLAYTSTSSLQIIATRFHDTIKGRKLELYIISRLLMTFILTFVVFSFAYTGLHSIDRSSFENTEGDFINFLGYSFSMLILNSASKVHPVSGFAQLFSHIESFGMWLLITIGASLLVNVTREKYKEDLEDVVNELNSSVDKISQQMHQDFHLTQADLELVLICKSLDFVNFVRKWKGQSALKAPAIESAETISSNHQVEAGDPANQSVDLESTKANPDLNSSSESPSDPKAF